MADNEPRPSSLKKVLAKCNHCYIGGTEKRLSACSRCKAAKYCSKECQTADWAKHKEICKKNSAHAAALKSPLNPFSLIPLPDGLTLPELDQRLEKWIKFHQPTLMGACLHALELPRDIKRTATHVMHLFVQIRTDHQGSAAKYFRILEAKVVSAEEAKAFPDPWRENLEDLQKMREDSEKMGRGTIAAIGVECPPLGVQMVPFGSLKRSSLSSMQILLDWKDILMKDIEEGKKFQRFGY